MKKHRLISILITAVTALAVLVPFSSHAIEDPKVNYTRHCCVSNADTGEIVFELGADDRVFPSGTVKMMTALLTLDKYESAPDSKITISDVATVNVSGFTCGLEPGSGISVSELLAAMIIGNCNDAALALAVDIGGSVDGFVTMMNEKAAEMGMENTHYLNPTGIDEAGMYTTARDVDILGRALSTRPYYINFSDSESYLLSEIRENHTIYNRNYFISSFYNYNYVRESVAGLSTGYTGESGQCVCALEKIDKGFAFVVTVMGASEPEKLPFKGCVGAYEDATDLIRWARKSFELFSVVNTADMICEVPVKLSASVDHVILLPKTNMSAIFPVDTDLDTELEYSWTLKKNELTAPISEGEVVGTLKVTSKTYGFLGEVELVAKNNVDRSSWLAILERLKDFFTSPLGIILCVLAVAFLIFVIVLFSMYLSRKNRRVHYSDPAMSKRHRR